MYDQNTFFCHRICHPKSEIYFQNSKNSFCGPLYCTYMHTHIFPFSIKILRPLGEAYKKDPFVIKSKVNEKCSYKSHLKGVGKTCDSTLFSMNLSNSPKCFRLCYLQSNVDLRSQTYFSSFLIGQSWTRVWKARDVIKPKSVASKARH